MISHVLGTFGGDGDGDGKGDGLDDLSPAQLWELLSARQQERAWREFLAGEWAEIWAWVEEEPAAAAAMAGMWMRWRDRAVVRLLHNGEIEHR